MQKNGKLHVLLGEDNPNDVTLLRHALEKTRAFADVKVARDGEEVMEYLQGKGQYANRNEFPFPDLLILDLKMPRMTGLEVLHWLRDNPKCAALPKVMLSGSGLEKDVEEAYRLGANTYFQKPSTVTELRELVSLLIKYWALSQRLPDKNYC
jgi:CheY-like chemotaxis protein